MDLHAKSEDEKTLALMASSVNCLWQPDSGAKNSEVSIFRAPKHGDKNRCEISISVARPLSSVIITSSGRTCEVLEPSARLNASPSYVSTIRGCEAEHEGVYRIKVDVQELFAARTKSIVLRMLSMKEKGIFCLHSLEIVEDEEPESSLSNAPASPHSVNPVSSQIEAVRQLVKDAQADAGREADPRQQLMASIARAALMQKAGPAPALVSALPDSLTRQLISGSESDALRGVQHAEACTAEVRFDAPQLFRHRLHEEAAAVATEAEASCRPSRPDNNHPESAREFLSASGSEAATPDEAVCVRPRALDAASCKGFEQTALYEGSAAASRDAAVCSLDAQLDGIAGRLAQTIEARLERCMARQLDAFEARMDIVLKAKQREFLEEHRLK